MKRMIALILAMLLALSCFAFAGCGEEKEPDKPDNKEQTGKKDDGGKENGYSDGGEEIELDDLIDTNATLDIPESVRYDGYTCTIFAPRSIRTGHILR